MRTSDFDYYLPPERIAQRPAEPRDSSRLLVLHRQHTGNPHPDNRHPGSDGRPAPDRNDCDDAHVPTDQALPDQVHIEHRRFRDLAEYLRPGDLVVFNRSRVIPARFHGVETRSGAPAEILLVRRLEPGIWQALARPGRRLRPGAEVVVTPPPAPADFAPPAPDAFAASAPAALAPADAPPESALR